MKLLEVKLRRLKYDEKLLLAFYYRQLHQGYLRGDERYERHFDIAERRKKYIRKLALKSNDSNIKELWLEENIKCLRKGVEK